MKKIVLGIRILWLKAESHRVDQILAKRFKMKTLTLKDVILTGKILDKSIKLSLKILELEREYRAL